MKNILILGQSSYIGKELNRKLQKNSNYKVFLLSLRGDSWREYDFSSFDVVVNLVGLAHVKETKENKNKYFEINRDLAFDAGLKAKNEGVTQFIFMSSMSVYGINQGIIDKNSRINPNSHYGKSKYEAEKILSEIEDDSFKVLILRPPMVYGLNSKGNYAKLHSFSKKTFIFPNYKNKRSMIHIDKLCNFIIEIIDEGKRGTFHPQDDDYVCTSIMVEKIASEYGRKLWMSKLFNPIIYVLINVLKIKSFTKIFGDLVYDKNLK
ncbi:NAD-dependent epimerase/dehydratase family protein [Exiguobacterium chiriqhucha]|uniref:NAD-dependent epimerase/dehydratase family protein n=1 Tax=Exiguobacterium chiriqhucha TaxID=1385984 RepID=UPI0038B9B934